MSRRARLWIAGAVLFLVALAGWKWIAFGARSAPDGAQYLSHALALAEGRPYGDIGYLYTPSMWVVGPPAYPPGAPLLLAPLLAAFGPDSPAPILLSYLLLGGFLVASGAYFGRLAGWRMGWSVALFVGAAFVLGDRVALVGSDLGFCAFIWLTLLLADAPGRSWGRTAGMMAAGSAALLTRIAAAPLVPAGLAHLFLNRKRGLPGMALAVAVWGGILWWMLAAFGMGPGPMETMTATAGGGAAAGVPAAEGAAGSPVPGVLDRLGAMARWWVQELEQRLSAYQWAISETFLYLLPGAWANRAYHLLGSGLAVVGLWTWLRGHIRSLLAPFAIFTVGMLAVAPAFEARYLWVLTPLLVYGFLEGASRAAAWIAARTGAPARTGSPARPVLAPLLAIVIVGAATAASAFRPYPAPRADPDAWREAGRILMELAPDPGRLRLASNRPRIATWHTEIPAMPIYFYDLDTFLAEAEERGIRHVIVMRPAAEPYFEQAWPRWRAERPDLFVPIADVGYLSVFEIAAAGTVTDPP